LRIHTKEKKIDLSPYFDVFSAFVEVARRQSPSSVQQAPSGRPTSKEGETRRSSYSIFASAAFFSGPLFCFFPFCFY
jgi:hypothetical protein